MKSGLFSSIASLVVLSELWSNELFILYTPGFIEILACSVFYGLY